MIVKISLDDWKALSKEGVILLGQDFDSYDVICMVESQPSCPYEEVSETYNNFKQVCVNHKLISGKISVSELYAIYARVHALGENGLKANDIFSIEILEELKEKEEEINALALTILDLMEV